MPYFFDGLIFLFFLKDIQEANFKTSSSRLLAAVMSALCHTSVKLTSIFPIAYDGEVLLRSIVKQVSTENDSTLVHRFPLLVAHMEKLSQVGLFPKYLLYWSKWRAYLSWCLFFYIDIYQISMCFTRRAKIQGKKFSCLPVNLHYSFSHFFILNET